MLLGPLFRRIVWCLALAVPMAGRADAQITRQFDGTWLTIITCAAAQDGAAGYTLRFVATVQNGTLHGQNGAGGQAAFLTLDGTIQPDGSATLSAEGLTASPTYRVGHVPPLRPVSYHIRAQFQGKRGNGARLELRPCEAVFSKQ